LSTKQVTEQAVYNNYRAALRSLRQANSQNHNSRAGGRKQIALQLTSDRYHVPVSEVKEIVRKLDEANGITHEQDPSYLHARAYEAARIAAAETREAEHRAEFGIGVPHSCDECNTTDSEKLIRIRRNPETPYSGTNWEFEVLCFPCWRLAGGDMNLYR
jgi:nitrate/TMAO reductase-like tetraheme cytochrome c subunit